MLDTSAVLSLNGIPREQLPARLTVSIITLAELQRGLYGGSHPQRIARRTHYKVIRSLVDVAPFSEEAAYYFGQLCGVEAKNGRNPKGRLLDLMIAATAVNESVPLLTLNPRDFDAAKEFIPIHVVTP